MWRIYCALGLACLAVESGGSQERFSVQQVPSRFLGAARSVRIFLPSSYASAPGRRYPVLYLHDGASVFSFAGTNIAFGWGSWELDKSADELSRASKMQEIILVGVDNVPATRMAEYSGAHHPAGQTNNTPFENYAAFLMQELKPKIDAEYRTRPEPANTGVMGSSLGGLCSVVLAWEHPEVFGRAASLSGAFQVNTKFLNGVLRQYRGQPKPVRFYLDSGICDFTGGDDGRAQTRGVASELGRIGWWTDLVHYVDARTLTPRELEEAGLRRDKWAEAQTSQHNEFYWRLRAWRALTFLFPVQTDATRNGS